MSWPAKDHLGEFSRIERFFRPLASGFPGALGLTDDAAILAPPPGQDLVVTTDAVVAGVHFLPDDPPDDVARKALRVNLSDLAAKGARPLAYTLTMGLGREVLDGWVERFAGGLASDQARYGIHLAGGDSVSTAGPNWISITAFGLAESGRMVRRSGAVIGDLVFVTGTIGDAALGLAVAQGRLGVADADAAMLLGRYRLPEPRTALVPAIATCAHAAIDISDGLAADFGHLCRASRMRGEIAAAKVPLSIAARRVLAAEPDLLSDILSGGDDYEVLLTAPARQAFRLHSAAGAVGIALTEIGRITGAAEFGAAAIVDAGGNLIALERGGWTHS